MTFTAAEVSYLTTGGAKASLSVSVIWSAPNGLPKGEVIVAAEGFPAGSVKFVLNLAAPNKPTFVLMIQGRHCYRLDVNQAHRDHKSTHIQQTDAAGVDIAVMDAANMFPPIPEHGTVRGEQYCATFLAFVKHLGIDPSPLDWTDPPERRP